LGFGQDSQGFTHQYIFGMDIVIAAVKDNHVAFLHIALNFLLAMASYAASLSTFQRYMVEVKRSH
jgi:hypothetical protein